MVTILTEPSTALLRTGALSEEVAQSVGTGIKLVESNFIISLGLIVYKYFQIYPSPLVPADLGSKSINVGSSKEDLPFGVSGVVPF